ncbi:MAG: hypothetical protein J6U54_07220 [Clostridiales bacterium]|nr:hypothetical protein [Clostridiales bacterium]
MSFVKKVKRWCRDHKRELIICGGTVGVIAGTVVISKKFGKHHVSQHNYMDMIEAPPTSDINYRAKYPNVVDGRNAAEGTTLYFLDNNIMNRWTSFNDVGHEHDLAVLVLNEATDEILNTIDVEDIKDIQMLIDLK